MHVVRSRNVNDAWPQILRLITEQGVKRQTRNGSALVVPEPVTVVYERPDECALFDPVRDHNPFFAVAEFLWLYAGRDDARWLDQFVHDFSARFAEADGHMHGSYGKRWRGHFKQPRSAALYRNLDQIDECVRLLRANPEDRQAVLQMWDPAVDLGVPGLKDRPCNLTIALRADNGRLDMTVFNRSNDACLGMAGANVVHMGLLQSCLAARIGLPLGRYSQVSNNLHLYEFTVKLCDQAAADAGALAPYPGTRALVDDPDSFDEELREFMLDPHHFGAYRTRPVRNGFLRDTAWPLWVANEERNKRDDPYRYDHALAAARDVAAPAWRAAAVAWLERRRDKLKAGEGQGHA
jgi:thymidylate synthase